MLRSLINFAITKKPSMTGPLPTQRSAVASTGHRTSQLPSILQTHIGSYQALSTTPCYHQNSR
jgi:hypothetical protein